MNRQLVNELADAYRTIHTRDNSFLMAKHLESKATTEEQEAAFNLAAFPDAAKEIEAK